MVFSIVTFSADLRTHVSFAHQQVSPSSGCHFVIEMADSKGLARHGIESLIPWGLTVRSSRIWVNLYFLEVNQQGNTLGRVTKVGTP